jgi:hypothetical protein
MDDYDQTLMELCDWEHFGANMDRPVKAAMGSGTASEDAGSEAGSGPGPVQQPPLPSVIYPLQCANFGLCIHSTNFDRRKFDCRV